MNKTSLGAKTVLASTPMMIVGTYDDDGKANVMAAAWGGICCSKPPCVNVSLRKATYSYDCIVKRKAYTVSIPSVNQVREADYIGIASGRDTDKFADTGLTPVRSELVDAPYVDEFPLVLECTLLHTLEIDLHTLFVGEIKDVKVDANAVSEETYRVCINALRPMIYSPLDASYHTLGESIGKGFTIGKEIGAKPDA